MLIGIVLVLVLPIIIFIFSEQEAGSAIGSYVSAILIPLFIIIVIFIIGAKSESPKSGNYTGYLVMIGFVTVFTPIITLMGYFNHKKEEVSKARGFLASSVIWFIIACFGAYGTYETLR